MPARRTLVLPEALMAALMTRPDLMDGTLDPDLLRRILERLEATAPDESMSWLDGAAGKKISRALLVSRAAPDVVPLDKATLVLPNGAPVQWSLPRRPEPRLHVESTQDRPACSEPDLDLSAVAPTALARANVPPTYISNVVRPALSARPQRKNMLRRGATAFAGLAAAAAAVALLVPARTVDIPPPARVATIAKAFVPPPRTRDAPQAAARLAVAPAGPSRVKTEIAQETPAKPPVAASPAPSAAPRDFPAVPVPVTIARAEPTPSLPVRPETAPAAPEPAAQTTIVPRDVSPPKARRTAQKKKTSVAAVAARKRPDVATLVLPDILKPQ